MPPKYLPFAALERSNALVEGYFRGNRSRQRNPFYLCW
jgi:hypothetical protein